MIKKLEDIINLSNLKNDTYKILSKFKFNLTNQISITHEPSAKTNEEKLYSGTGRLLGQKEELDFNIFNNEFVGTEFHNIYKYCEEHWRVGRMRLMNCPPRHCYSMHVDDSEVRYHVVIDTNPYSYLIYHPNKMYHLPDDGHVYEVNTRQLHSVMNSGDRDRIHLVYELDYK